MYMKRKKIRAILLFCVIAVWILFLFLKSPEDIVKAVGVQNGYLLVFFSSFLGGLAAITVVTVYPTIIIFAMGGLNPFILGVSAAIGMTIANVIYFFIGEEGRGLAEPKGGFRKFTDRMLKKCDKLPFWLVQILILLYVGFTPFPNGLLTASGGLINYSFRKILLPLLLGNLILMTFIAYVGSLGI